MKLPVLLLVPALFFAAALDLAAQTATGTAAPRRLAGCVGGRISDDLYAVRECGPPANRVNLVFIGDGYQAAELGAWATHVDSMVSRLFGGESPPYERYASFINVYRIDLVSNESGVDVPGSGIFVDTALDGCNCCIDYTIGQCQVDWAKTHAAIDAATPGIDIDWRLVGLNTGIYLGGTHYPPEGTLAVYGTGHALAFEILAHEGGHGFHWLADEYHAPQYDNTFYTGPEPSQVNLTIDSSGNKWAPWLGFAQPHLGGPVGAYEGGGAVYGKGIWRPSFRSRMNNLRDPLDAIGQEAAIHSIYNLVRPIDLYGPAQSFVPPDTPLWVRVIDPAVLLIDWFIDDVWVASGEDFDLATRALTPGLHAIEARVRDEVLDHAFSDNANPHALDLVRRNTSRLTQTVSWLTFVP